MGNFGDDPREAAQTSIMRANPRKIVSLVSRILQAGEKTPSIKKEENPLWETRFKKNLRKNGNDQLVLRQAAARA